MLSIKKLSQKPKVFHSLCGLQPIKFNLLVKQVEPLWQKAELKRKKQLNRQRKVGGGRKPDLSLEQLLFLLLLYYRTYITHEFIGLIANIDGTNIGRWFFRLEPVLAQVFKIPQRKITLSEKEILELIVDATEQETQKRKGSGYSGKKKKNTVKTQIHITAKEAIKAVSKSYPGNIHDKKVYDTSKTFALIKNIPQRVPKKGDLGYLGTGCQIPIKSSKKHKLTPKEKLFNQNLAKERIAIEHVFSYLKKFHILSDKYRNDISRYNLIFKNICGLRNFITA